MHKYTPSAAHRQSQSGLPHNRTRPDAAPRNAFKANCDIFGIRAIYQVLEKDFERILEQKIRRWERLEARLGSQKVFDLPADDKGGEAGKIHRQASILKFEIDTLIALRRYLEDLIEFSLSSWAALSDGWASHCQTLEQEVARTRAELHQSLDNELELLTMWCNSLIRKSRTL